MKDYTAYIDSLEASGEKMTRNTWTEWIKKEATDLTKQDERMEAPTDQQIAAILDRLDEDGYII